MITDALIREERFASEGRPTWTFKLADPDREGRRNRIVTLGRPGP
jgi:hypothetical protein